MGPVIIDDIRVGGASPSRCSLLLRTLEYKIPERDALRRAADASHFKDIRAVPGLQPPARPAVLRSPKPGESPRSADTCREPQHQSISALRFSFTKMDLRVASFLLVLLAVAEATPDRYYHVPKVAKAAYPVKSHAAPVNLDLKAHQESQAPWVPQDPLARAAQAILEPRAPLAPPAPQDTHKLANPEAPDPLGNQERLVILVRKGPLEPLEPWALAEPLDPLGPLDLLDFHLWENLVLLACQEQWDTEESLEREASEFLVFRGPLAPSDQWAPLECLANLAWENPVPQDTQESLVRLEHQEEMALQAQWECQEPKVTLELQAWGRQGNQVRTALLVCQDRWALKAPRGQLGSQGPLECQVLVKLESQEPQEAEDPLVPPEPQDRRESLAPLVSLDTQGPQVLLAPLVLKVQEDSRVNQAHTDQRETSVWLERQAPEEARESKELRDSLESPVFPVQSALREAQGTMVLRGLKVLRATLGPQDSLDLTVLRDTKDTPVPLALLANLVSLECPAPWAQLVHLVQLALLVLKVTLDFQVLQVPLV
uniref:Uncharacterized protein n=1 Tax=Knipowitschia caucasica TaxID=637954 RepID=A0AAV2K678_KNICA